ncbi:MAG: flagellin [Fibrobacterota bacterium]
MQALFAQRAAGISAASAGRSLEKLSSGVRITRAADDAAGLSISEQMRAQVRGLQRASRNSRDGISLIQTAEGALNETHALLQRMRHISVQSANDTYVQSDRSALQQEMDALTSEVERISRHTEFNGKPLLDGSLAPGEETLDLQVGANAGQKLSLNIRDMSAAGDILDVGISRKTRTHIVTIVSQTNPVITQAEDIDVSAYTREVPLDISMTTTQTPDNSGTDGIWEIAVNGETAVIETGSDAPVQNLTLGASDFNAFLPGESITVNAQDSWTAGDQYYLRVLGPEDSVVGPAVTSSTASQVALGTIDAAVEAVSEQRATLGAVRNRLEHAVRTADNAATNLSTAESRIRDVDMAREMTTQIRARTLHEAARAMLSQAQMQPRNILQLLS